MEVHFAPEIETKLAQSAAQRGHNLDELVQDAVAKYFDEESRFIKAVLGSEEALQCANTSRRTRSGSAGTLLRV